MGGHERHAPHGADSPRSALGRVPGPDGDLFHLRGEFREVEPPARLAFTFWWDPPDADDRETLVTLSLEDRGPETEVHLVQGKFATEERYALHEAGWTESFERLEELLRA